METSTAPRERTATPLSQLPTTATSGDGPPRATSDRWQRRAGAVALLLGLGTAAVALLTAVQHLTW